MKNRLYDKLAKPLVKAPQKSVQSLNLPLSQPPPLYPIEVYNSDREKLIKHLEEEQKVNQWSDCIKMLVRNNGVGKFRLSEDFPPGAMEKIAKHVFSDAESDGESKEVFRKVTEEGQCLRRATLKGSNVVFETIKEDVFKKGGVKDSVDENQAPC